MMTAKDKRNAFVIVGVGIIVLLLLLWRRPSPVIQGAGGDVSFGGVSLPGFNYQPGQYGPIVLPGLSGNDFDLSMIGACCADCSGASAPVSYVPAGRGFTYVYNEGNKGPNVYIYQPPTPPKAKSGAGGLSFFG